MSALLVLSAAAQTALPFGVTKTLIRSGVECQSEDKSLMTDGRGKAAHVDDCANRCADSKECRFFIFGVSGIKVGDCFSESTTTAECAEGWVEASTGFYDFYELAAPWVGCAEPRARNYGGEQVTVNDDSCQDLDPCAELAKGRHDHDRGACDRWREWCEKPCTEGNVGYRNKENDTVHAAKVPRGSITIDGDLRDWQGHKAEWSYRDVPFADASGSEVVFESQGSGKWFGPDDFSIAWMLAWDEVAFYLAVDVTDDIFQVGARNVQVGSWEKTFCWKTGLQLGFEVGGPDALASGKSMAGILHEERSASLKKSMFDLINIGLYPGQTSCLTSVNMSQPADYKPDSATTRECCVEYVKNNGDAQRHLSNVAIIRNENNKHTIIEAAISKMDLLGTSDEHLSYWAENLRFGFSMAVNDGDEVAEQQGWGGFYPNGLVQTWNNGQKEPAKAGVVHLAGRSSAKSNSSGSSSTSSGGVWLGVSITLLGVALFWVYGKYRKGGMPAVKEGVTGLAPSALQQHLPSTGSRVRAPPPLASADVIAGSYNAPTPA